MKLSEIGPFRRFITSLSRTRKLRRLHFDCKPETEFVLVNTDGGSFVVSAGDSIIGRYCYVWRKPADFEKLTRVCGLLPEEHRREILVDIGANVGTICIPAIGKGLFERAVAIEPEPQNYRLLSANVVLSGLSDRIVTHNRAMADTDDSELRFELSADNHGDHRVRMTDSPGLYAEEQRTEIRVKSMTIESLDLPLARDNALIWMDVQGFEGVVLQGAAHCIDEGVPLCMEFSPYGLHRAGSFDKLISALTSAPYSRIVDLDSPTEFTDFDVAVLHRIADKLGPTGDFTDLLIC